MLEDDYIPLPEYLFDCPCSQPRRIGGCAFAFWALSGILKNAI
jgi:hypothetical protein